MAQAVEALRGVSTSDKFKELERLRSLARHNEASALANARRQEREKWQGVVAEKEAAYNTVIAEQAALIEKLMAQVNEGKSWHRQ